jgi:hypothetical protein
MTTIAAIYGARKAAGLEDDTARDLYQRETGKRSLRDMSPGEQVRVLQAIKSAGAGKGPASRVEGPYAKKLIALWLDGWNLGVFADRRDASLIAFVKRQTGLEATRFLRDAGQAQAVVEALKGWIAREGDVAWGEHADLMDDVLDAQARKLDLASREAAGESGALTEAYCAWRRDELDRSGKIGVMQLLGVAIRAIKDAR